MADQTYYRYIDSDGSAHYVDHRSEVPHAHKGSIHELVLAHDGSAKATAYADTLLTDMHWPSFAMGCAVAAAVVMVLRFVFSKRVMFAGVASVIAAGGFGSATYLRKLKSDLPTAVTNMLPAAQKLRDLPTPTEAKRILEALPKASADRDKALEAIFESEKQ